MPRNFQEEAFEVDFANELSDSILIQPWLRNTGYVDVFGEGATHNCHVQYETFSVTKADGSLTATTMQVFLAGDVVVTVKDKITVNGVSPKILRVSPDPDNYGLVILT